MGQIKVFLDSNVIISALLSKSGASYQIINNPRIRKVISETIKEEVMEVSARLRIGIDEEDILDEIKIIRIFSDKSPIVVKYQPYVLDVEDSHVVAGTVKAETRFLLTHNLIHFRIEKIRNDFGIIVMKPGIFLQYLRSL